jgi:hypothetical protein
LASLSVRLVPIPGWTVEQLEVASLEQFEAVGTVEG